MQIIIHFLNLQCHTYCFIFVKIKFLVKKSVFNFYIIPLSYGENNQIVNL